MVLADELTGSLDSKSSEQVFHILETWSASGARQSSQSLTIYMAARMDRRLHLVDGMIETDGR